MGSSCDNFSSISAEDPGKDFLKRTLSTGVAAGIREVSLSKKRAPGVNNHDESA